MIKILTGGIAMILLVVGCQAVRHSGGPDLPPSSPTTLRLATYNVHYIVMGQATGPWSVADWERRKGPLDLAFKAIAADVIAFQEMESFARGSGNTTNLTLAWLLANNAGYAAAAVGDPTVFPSTQPILYRSDRVALLDQGWFFFSPTPDVIYARTFNGSYPAFASWAAFHDRQSGSRFRVVNIHTDYASRSNRLQSAALVAQRIRPWIDSGETVFVAGDLNARAGDQTLALIEDAGIDFASIAGATYHFNRGLNLFGAIDHIGVAGDAERTAGPVVIRDKFAGEWPTDHYPVVADFRLGAD